MTSRTLYDAHPEEIIDPAKFDVCTSSSFGGVKAHVRSYTRTDRIVLCVLVFITFKLGFHLTILKLNFSFILGSVIATIDVFTAIRLA